jgi:hypothetical protein
LAQQKYSPVLILKRAECSAVRMLLDGILSLFKKDRDREDKTETETEKRERERNRS